MTLAEMKARVEELKRSASAILDKVEAAGRTALTAEEETRFGELKSEIDTLNTGIEEVERLAELRRSMAPAALQPALNTGVLAPQQDPTDGFQSIAHFATAVREASVGRLVDQRLQAAAPSNVHQGGGSDGEGYLVPTQFTDQIWNAVEDVGGLMSRFDPEPTQRRSIEFIADETTPWGAAGVQAVWRSEAGKMTPSKFALKGKRMEVHDLYAFAAVTEETLQDAPRLENQITRQAARAINWASEEAIIWGDGVGKPFGYMKSTALIKIAKESGQAANTIVPDNINKMYSRLMMMAGSSAFWLANSDIFPQLQALNVGGQTPIFYPPGGIAQAPNGALLGKPIEYTEHAETLGTLGDLQLIDPGGYLAARRTGAPVFARSIHLWFDYNIEAFRWTFRMGGQPLLSEPVQPARGNATKSYFLALADRN